MAAVQPRLSSTELPTKAPYALRLQMFDLGFEQRRYVGPHAAYGPLCIGSLITAGRRD